MCNVSMDRDCWLHNLPKLLSLCVFKNILILSHYLMLYFAMNWNNKILCIYLSFMCLFRFSVFLFTGLL